MNNLAKYRGLHGMTQTELGKQLGISKAGVSFIEKNNLSAKTVQKCANILNENPFAIFGDEVLKMLPKTEEDKKILIDIIKGL